MGKFENFQFDLDHGVASITVDRPADANSINLAAAREFYQAALSCHHDPQVRAVLVRATGSMFCAGGDLKAFAALGEDGSRYIRATADAMHQAIMMFRRMNAPVVIAIGGMAAGAGMSLALAGDFAIASKSARFTMAFTAAGLVPDTGATFHLPKLVGLRRAQELIFTNRVLDADEAQDWGLVNRVVADGELDFEAMGLARRLASGPTNAFGMAKRLMLDSFCNGLDQQLVREAEAVAGAADHANGQEGIAAFMDKRRPEFS